MNLVLLGAPGAGKGTQASLLERFLNIPHISTGDIFRSNIADKTDLGLKAEKFISKGELVPDDMTIEIVKNRLIMKDCAKGFILDGFPRTIFQAKELDRILNHNNMKIDKVIDFEIDDELAVKLLSKRLVCPECGRSYHTEDNPSQT
ncbi:MAG: nucleoside monophosphate kinase, partial [Clostridiales bacterium]|nr:nucleoside monophosphate kinase [Clostridiales bacterium]